MSYNWRCTLCESFDPPRRNICWKCGKSRLANQTSESQTDLMPASNDEVTSFLAVRRRSDVAGIFRKVAICLDGEIASQVSNSKEIKIEVKPGTHTIQAKLGKTLGTARQIHIDAHQTRAFLIALDQDDLSANTIANTIEFISEEDWLNTMCPLCGQKNTSISQLCEYCGSWRIIYQPPLLSTSCESLSRTDLSNHSRQFRQGALRQTLIVGLVLATILLAAFLTNRQTASFAGLAVFWGLCTIGCFFGNIYLFARAKCRNCGKLGAMRKVVVASKKHDVTETRAAGGGVEGLKYDQRFDLYSYHGSLIKKSEADHLMFDPSLRVTKNKTRIIESRTMVTTLRRCAFCGHEDIKEATSVMRF